MPIHVLIPCAGGGSRIGAETPKQYLPLAGRSVLEHTLHAFAEVARVDSVSVVVRSDDTRAAPLLAGMAGVRLAPVGGSSRAASVAAGLDWLSRHGAVDDDWVLVHDAARCCITADLVDTLIDACVDDAVGGLLALPLPDTLKRASADRVAATVARDGLWLAQTPQMFRLGLLRQALAGADLDSITDEASAIESMGLQPRLVNGALSNFKVTYRDDLELAASLLQARAQEVEHG